MPGGGKRIVLTVQEDRIRGGTAPRDRGGERKTLLAYGGSLVNGDPFIDGGWRTVLRMAIFRNIPIFETIISRSQITTGRKAWGFPPVRRM